MVSRYSRSAALQGWMVATLCAALTASACGGARYAAVPAGLPVPPAPDQAVDRAVLAEYVQKLPPGTTVRVERENAKTLRGTLMKATADAIFIQPKTRIPEPSIEVPLRDVQRVTPEAPNGGNLAKAIGIGAAAGAGAALGVFFVILAIFAD